MDLKILQSMTEFHMSHIISSCINTICALRSFWTVLPRGYKTFSMLNSAEHEISTAHKN